MKLILPPLDNKHTESDINFDFKKIFSLLQQDVCLFQTNSTLADWSVFAVVVAVVIVVFVTVTVVVVVTVSSVVGSVKGAAVVFVVTVTVVVVDQSVFDSFVIVVANFVLIVVVVKDVGLVEAKRLLQSNLK